MAYISVRQCLSVYLSIKMQVDSIHVNKSCITAKQTKNKLYEDVI